MVIKQFQEDQACLKKNHITETINYDGIRTFKDSISFRHNTNRSLVSEGRHSTIPQPTKDLVNPDLALWKYSAQPKMSNCPRDSPRAPVIPQCVTLS